MKKCKECLEEKPSSEFNKRTGATNGITARCKTCLNAKARNRYCSDKDRGRQYMRRYGITLEEVTRMAEAQNYQCPICLKECSFIAGNRANAFVVDHCHDTNRVRALICATCNRGLGLFYDRAELLVQAAEYLKSEGVARPS